MWMMMDSNNDHGLKPQADHIIGRKLRPLMPRPIGNHPYSTPSCCCTRNPKMLSWNHSITAAPVVSTRWNPTAEQLHALEEMYRRGIRTPTADQIQQIAAKLGRLGKIEGKNVFYWFQNHKARERQKKRRQLELELLAEKKMMHHHHTQTKQTEVSRRCKVPIPSSCSTSSADSASMHGAVIGAESGKDGWPQLQNKLASAENEACSSSTNTYPYGNENEQNQTLQLFPTGQEICDGLSRSTRIQFIEFLPIKN